MEKIPDTVNELLKKIDEARDPATDSHTTDAAGMWKPPQKLPSGSRIIRTPFGVMEFPEKLIYLHMDGEWLCAMGESGKVYKIKLLRPPDDEQAE